MEGFKMIKVDDDFDKADDGMAGVGLDGGAPTYTSPFEREETVSGNSPFRGEETVDDNSPLKEETVNSDSALKDEEAVKRTSLKEEDVLRELGEEFGKIKYLETERNLELPQVRAENVDVDAPFSSLTMAGKWLREATDLSNYWQGIQQIGEEVASYKWAYDEGKLGAFNGREFAKEALRAGVRSLGSNTLRTSGNLLTMFGANLENGSLATTLMTAGSGAVLPQTGQLFKDLGKAFRTYADDVDNVSFLAAPQDVFADEPSWNKLANVVGAGSSQVLAMGGMSRMIGAGATYGLFAGGNSGEIFNETLDKSGDVDQANVLAAANAGVTFAIDKLFNPLPETIAKNAKLTSHKIAEEMLGAPLREAGSEVLQQMLAENLVRKVGLDDTQDLFEGLLESALGAFAGSSMLTGASGSVYLARKNLDEARRKIMLKGVSAEELELYQKNMMALIEQKPDAFEKILGANLKENLKQMDLAARQLKNRKEREAKRGEIQGFQAVYDEMYDRFFSALGDEQKAKMAARVFEANAISLYQQDSRLTPRKLVDGLLPKLEKIDAAAFLAKRIPEQAVSYSLIGINAKNADTDKLTKAMTLRSRDADPQTIWRLTGWHFGADGKWRMEISDREARIIPWDGMKLQANVEGYFKDYRLQTEKIKAYLAAALRNSAANGLGQYYDDFYKYLNKRAMAAKKGDEEVGFEDNLRQVKKNLFELMEEGDRKRREAEDAVLADVFRKYLEMHPDKRENADIEDVVDSLARSDRKTYDFTEEQYKYIMGVLETRRRRSFFDKYWDKRTGVANNKDFRLLAEKTNFEYNDNQQYLEQLLDVVYTADKQRKIRGEELDKLGVGKIPVFFEDIDMNEAYGKYRTYQGDFTEDLSNQNFYPASYVQAFRPLTASETFLEQPQYEYLKDADKRLLASYLDVVEKIFRMDKFLEQIDAVALVNELRPQQSEDARLYFQAQSYRDGESFNPAFLQQRMMMHSQEDMRLGDILEHKVLFENYPTIADMQVRFVQLDKRTPYHVYYHRGEGYVLEIDTRQVRESELKEVLLKGAAFAVQDMEGFDYSLTEAQRRNFMDRQMYLAAHKLQEAVVRNVYEYVEHYLPGVNADKFIFRQQMPEPLVNLTRSAQFAELSPDDMKMISYKTVDYDKLFEAVKEKYATIRADEAEYVRELAYLDFQQVKRMNNSMIMAEARVSGGYSAGILPWAGITSQGAMDARALVERMEFTEQQLAEKPFFEQNGDLRAVREETSQENKSDIFYVPDVADPYDEFAKIVAADAKNYRNTIDVLARGAYDSASKTISLFETADAETIIHETFHYFWDMMQQAEYRNESHAANFHEVMTELKEDFVRHYVVKQFDGKWYALHQDSGEIMEEMPRGFGSKSDAIDAGVRELFVARLVKLMNGRTFTNDVGSILDAADFYRKWMLSLTGKLEISKDNVSNEGRKVLMFLKYKIK
ncbi:MAG: hypothetical protein NC218_10990 [Acetobacter sp.]|nr:hypothetical protein [Acetobacter sp.]